MKQKMLIVEDSKINRELLSRMLQDEYEIYEAGNGKAALEMLYAGKNHFAAMILDLQMPEMDGKEVLKALNQNLQFKNLPILVATGEHDEAVESECLRLGAWDYVAKPYSQSVISVRLKNIIARSQNHLLREIQHLSRKDVLTNLYNRRYFMQKAKEMIEKNQDTTFCMVRIDIDHFRLYNASFGSEAGDELLKQIAGKLEKSVPKSGHERTVYGRIESDIFCVCLPYQKEMVENSIMVAENAIQKINSNYHMKASFGICVFQNTIDDMEELYAHTVEAAKKCKNNMNTVFAYYDSAMSENEKRAQMLTNEMAQALEEEQFKIFLQPKYSIDTEKPCGAEALVRWQHPEWGKVSPADFIPVFEQNGLIVQLDFYMWEHVCKMLHNWIADHKTVVPVSVNVSRISLYDPKIVSFLVGLTEKYHVPRHLMNLEITESAYMSNPDLMKSIIEELRSNGFVIMMDDFGSGYSSLNTLKDIEVDILKIDMKFLPTGKNNAKSEKILASVARMAGWLGMPVVVEGVETREQKDFLESIGCYYVQGFFYAKPMPVEAFEKLICSEKIHEDKKVQFTGSMENKIDAVWSSDSTTGALLESVSLPFAVFEYAEKKLDILRINRAFIDTFALKNIERYFSYKEYSKLLNAIEEVILNQGRTECECMAIMEDGKTRWFCIRLSFIGMTAHDALVSGTFSDITTEMLMENELNKITTAFHGERHNRECILIIDDQEISREILAGMFEEDYEILQAKDGKEGLFILEEQCDQIAAILLDMVMPVMDGQEFLQYKNRLKEATEIPVIVISSESAEGVQLNMLENGVNDYVTKPFVPALVKKRLQNVMEYNSRFRTLMHEYQKANTISSENGKKSIILKGYSMAEVNTLMKLMGKIFEVVRLVDPEETAVVNFHDNGQITRVPYSCFSIWGREVRCENCTSLCAAKNQCTMNKFELLKNDVFYVVSQPIEIYLDEMHVEKLVLEVASKILDSDVVPKNEMGSFCQSLYKSHNMIYLDPLTGAFNRRFLDEMLFLHMGQNRITTELALIMMDLTKFKQINDLFGHQMGDKVLKGVVHVMKKQIRSNDSIIRYGGDEFIIMLTNCGEEQTVLSIERLRAAVHTVKYGPKDTISTEADFGYAFQEHFIAETENLSNMIKIADEMMYNNKKQHKSLLDTDRV